MDSQTDTWSYAAEKAWQAVLDGVRALRDSGMKLDEVCALMGVKSKAQMSEWIKGNRTAVNAPFGCMLRYLATLGHDPRDFVPSVTGEMPEPSHAPKATAPAPSCVACKKLMTKEKELQKAMKDNEKLRLGLAKRDGMVEALERQLDRRSEAGRQAETEPAERKMAE